MTGPGIERVWIDDRHPIFRQGVCAILAQEGYVLAGESANLQPEPDVDEVDILIFEASSHTLPRALRLRNGGKLRLVATLHAANERLVADAVQGGAAAVLLRAELGPRTLIGCLRAVVGGSTALPTELLPRIIENVAHNMGGPAALTEREISVLELLAAGEDTRDIAGHLAYSERTVKNIVHDVLMKLNCRNRVQAVAHAIRQGLI